MLHPYFPKTKSIENNKIEFLNFTLKIAIISLLNNLIRTHDI